MCTLGSHPATGFPGGHASSSRTRTTTTNNSRRRVAGSKWGVRMHPARPRPAASLEEPCSTPPPPAPHRRCLLPGSDWPACAWGCLPMPSSGAPSPSWPATPPGARGLRRRRPPLPSRPCWRGASVATAELPAYVVLGIFAVHFGAHRHCAPFAAEPARWTPAGGRPRAPGGRLAGLGNSGGPASRSRRVRNLVLFLLNFGFDQQKRPRNGRREARSTTWTVLRLPRLVAAVLWRSPGASWRGASRPCSWC